MSWNLEGLTIEAKYLDSIPVKGKVEISRVKYGGEVSHHVDLITPIVVYGAIRESIIIENKYVEKVLDNSAGV